MNERQMRNRIALCDMQLRGRAHMRLWAAPASNAPSESATHLRRARALGVFCPITNPSARPSRAKATRPISETMRRLAMAETRGLDDE